jgi:hypothetical protein
MTYRRLRPRDTQGRVNMMEWAPKRREQIMSPAA